MYFSIHSLEPPAVLPFWRNGPRRKRSTRRGLPVLAATPSRLPTCSAVPRLVPIPAYRPRRSVRFGGNARRAPNLLRCPGDRFQFQPTDPGDRSVVAATPGGVPTCSIIPSQVPIPDPGDRSVLAATPGGPQPAPLPRGQLHVQPKTAGPGAFWRQRRAGPQPAPLPRGQLHVQPKTAGPGAFWRQRPAGPPTCSAVPRPVHPP